MILEGNVGVIDAIKEKKRLMDAGLEHEHIKPMLICGGGCMKGSYAWGAALALSDLGYQNCFHTVAGISVGALTTAYFLSGNIREVESLPYAESVSRDFFNVWRPFNILNTAYMRSVVEGKPGRSLLTGNIFSHQTKLVIALSRYKTATPYLLSPEEPEELYEGLRATISMAGAVSDPAVIDGERYLDGATTYPYVRTALYNLPEVTHILDITNQDQDMKPYNYIEAFLLETFYRPVTTQVVRYAANQRRKQRKEFLEHIVKEQPKPICLAWGNHSIGSLEAKRDKMKKVVDDTRAYWHQLLA